MAIIDKVIVGINKGITTVGANSKAMVEKAKVKTTIENLESERVKLVQLLGQRVFDRYRAGNEIKKEDFEDFCREIGIRVDELAKQHQALLMIEDDVNRAIDASVQSSLGADSCICGQVNRQGAKFCAGCGSQL